MCGGVGGILVRVPFDDPRIRRFIGEYYGGRVVTGMLAGEQYELAHCASCGFIWQKNILDDNGMEALYAHWISSEESLNKKEKGFELYVVRYGREAAHIASFFPGAPLGRIRVMDYGAGWGFWLHAAKNRGYGVVGVEIAEDRIRYARERFGVDMVRTTHDANGTFSFINAEQVFEHVADPRGELRALARLLEPGGVVHIAVPDGSGTFDACKSGEWEPKKGPTQPLEHINTYTPATLESLATAAGLIYEGEGSDAFRSPLRKIFERLFGRPRSAASTSVYFRKSP